MNYKIKLPNGTISSEIISYKEIKSIIEICSKNYNRYCSDLIIEIVNYKDNLYFKYYFEETWCSCTLSGMCGDCRDNQEMQKILHIFDEKKILEFIANAKIKELESKSNKCCHTFVKPFTIVRLSNDAKKIKK